MRPLPALVVSTLLALPAAAGPDPKALAVAERVSQALGGEAAWNATRYLRFDFAVEAEGQVKLSRAHTWDKWTGRYRLEGRNKEGQAFVVLMNLNTKQGSAWVGGEPVLAEALQKQLENAYGAWVNDTYWLLMPYKLRDPGVSLAYAGQAEGCDKILLTFDKVGLTPKDRYWVWVNQKTGLVDRWDFVLKGEAGPPTTFEWKGWKAFGKIQLAADRREPKTGRRIFFPVLETPASVEDAAFTTR